MPLPCAPRQEAPESVSDWYFPRSSRTWVQSLHERSLASIMLLPAGLVVGGSSKCQSCKQGSRVQSWLVQEWRSAGRSLPSDERPALTGGSAPVHHHHAGCGKADVHEGESPARSGRRWMVAAADGRAALLRPDPRGSSRTCTAHASSRVQASQFCSSLCVASVCFPHSPFSP